MTDRRITPDPALVTQSESASVGMAITDLNQQPQGPRDRQLIFGDEVTVLNRTSTQCYIQSEKDGYCGYVTADALVPRIHPTHKICAAATHAYQDPDIKSSDTISLSFGSQITVLDTTDKFARMALGHIPLNHLKPLQEFAPEPAIIAQLFLETPYLWGGNSRWGIDCSGLVQAALHACGTPCPGDSDQQQALGAPASGPYQRNDLIFWKGHVALALDSDTLIHANAGSMTTRTEPILDAIARIHANGDGSVTAHRRLS